MYHDIPESLRALIEPGYLRIVYGGGAEGAYLVNHATVEEIHITGSDKTHDAIVFGGKLGHNVGGGADRGIGDHEQLEVGQSLRKHALDGEPYAIPTVVDR